MAVALVHHAFLYEQPDDYVRTLAAFASEGLDAGDAVLIAVPRDNLARLRRALRAPAAAVMFADMTQVGRNPARIIPFIADFLSRHGDRHVRFVGEPIWRGRSPAEIAEGIRHEALINMAFADANATVVCPYDAVGLDAGAIAAHTHPTLQCDGAVQPSGAYRDPLEVYAADDRPLPAPSAPVDTRDVSADLASLRSWVLDRARAASLRPGTASDLVLAANEAVSNTLRHAGGHGTARIWSTPGETVFELADGGRIHDPLAGRRAPGEGRAGGRGLWLINHLCDLVELRSGASGTVIRLHMAHR